jgi:hypothetical protein
MTAQARDAELAAALRDAHDTKRRSCQTVTERAVARGELANAAGADTLAEVLPALMNNRLLVTGEPLDDAFITHVVDHVALPLLGIAPAPAGVPMRKAKR